MTKTPSAHAFPSASGDRHDLHTVRAPEADSRFAVPVRGNNVDSQTRCTHYHGPTDIVALRCACCETFYPCHACHLAVTGRPFEPWPLARALEPAVLCGVCHATITPEAYRTSGDTCAGCSAAFNPGCRSHHCLYFEPLAPKPPPNPWAGSGD